MYRIVKLSGKFYAYEFDSIISESNNIKEFIDTGDVVCLCDDISEFADTFDIEIDDIETVD